MKRLLSKWTIAVVAVAALLLLATAVCAFMLSTETGARWVWQRLEPALPDTVKVDAIHGRLIGPLAATGVEVQSDTSLLRIDRIELEWSPLALLGRRLDIQRLLAAEVHVTQLAKSTPRPEAASEPFQLPEEIVLPLDVDIDELRLQNIEFRPAPGADPVKVDTISLKLAINEENAVITDFFTTAPRLSVRGDAAVSMSRNFPIDGTLDWRFDPPDFPELTGNTVIDGDLEEVKILQKIDMPYAIDATFVIANLMTQPSFRARITADPERLRTISDGLPEMAVRLEATGQGDLEEMDLKISASLEEAAFGAAQVQLDAGLRSSTLFLHSLSVTTPDQPARLNATGQLSLKDDRQFNFKVDWAQLQWPLQNPRVTSATGALSINGRIDDYAIGITADMQGPEKTDASLQASGRGTQKGVKLTRFDVRSLDGGIWGSADLEWDPEPGGTVDLNGKGLNPGVLFDAWPGDLQLHLRASGRSGARGPAVKVETLKADGRLRGNVFRLDAMGAYAENTAVLDRFELSSGATRLQAHGTIGETADIAWEINSEDLGSLLPDADGAIRGNGRVTGPVRRPRCKADLKARDLAYAGYNLKTLNLDADADLNGKERSSISLDVESGVLPGVEIRSLNLRARGDAGDHVLELVADTDQGTADLSLEGQLTQPWHSDMIWQFRLNEATLTYPKLEAWTLRTPFSGEIGAARIQLSRNCWQSGEAQLCLEGDRSEEAARAAFDISALPFSYFNNYLPEGVTVEGGLNGSGTYRHSGPSEPVATLLLDTTKTALRLTEDIDEQQAQARKGIVFLPGRLRIELQQGEVKADMALPVSDTEGIELEAFIAKGSQPIADRPMTARLSAVIQNLAFIQSWLPDVDALTGHLSSDITLSGNLGHPVLTGRVELTDGAAKLARPGLDLKGINISVQGEENGAMRLTGRSVSGRGEITINGTADFRNDTTRADIRLKGQNFTVVNTREAEVEASPDLKIGFRDDLIDVTGEIVIPKAGIQIKKPPASAVQVSEDQTIAGSESGQTEAKGDRKINARVRITMGDDVTFDGFGLNAGIQGGLLAIEKPGKPTTGSGELNLVDGTYEAYGQKLDIDKGRVLWAGGPISQPGIDARAVRRPEEDILVGVNVRGDLRQPDVTLFSEPAMTQGNQLSYLVLGRPLSGASTGEGSALSRAVLALGLKGGNAVAEKIGGKLGLDQFTVESSSNGSSTDAQQASLVIGKYLTPKLYINYGIGLFDPVSTLRLQYAISSSWKLVTESSGTASGGDLIYTIETGR